MSSQQTSSLGITVVVPVYGDWPSLKLCIGSLREHYPDISVLFVNDCGPDVELMERNIQVAIKSHPTYQYHRNPKNLGFVRTCNRAALELETSDNDILLLNSDTIVTSGFLEEMASILHSDDKHGTVSPRSNSASNYSIPVHPAEPTQLSMEAAYAVFETISPLLPRFYEAPDSHGFCMLIRRSLIQEYGLFDEVYGKGNAEETDFCLRIQHKGYKSLIANHAFVFHFHSRSFSAEEKDELKAKNSKILKSRYPEVDDLVRKYMTRTLSPLDWFAQLVANADKPRIMIDLSHMPQEKSDYSQQIFDFLRFLGKQKSLRKVFSVVTNPDVDEYYSFASSGLRVIHMGTYEEQFHVGFCPFVVHYPNNLHALNRMGLRWAFAIEPSYAESQNQVSRDALRFADRIFLSDANQQHLIPNEAVSRSGEGVHNLPLTSHAEFADHLIKLADSSLNVDALGKRWRHFSTGKESDASTTPRLAKVPHKLRKLVHNWRPR